MSCGSYKSLAKLHAMLCVASCIVFLITVFTSKSLVNEARLLLVCGGASIVFYYVSKLLVNAFRTA